MIFAGELTEKLTFYEVRDVQSESGFKHTSTQQNLRSR